MRETFYVHGIAVHVQKKKKQTNKQTNKKKTKKGTPVYLSLFFWVLFVIVV